MLEVHSDSTFFSSTFLCTSPPRSSGSGGALTTTTKTTGKKRKLSPQFDRVQIQEEHEPHSKKRATRTYYAPVIYSQHYSFLLSSRSLSGSNGSNTFFHSEPNLANCLRLLPELCVFDLLPTEINIRILGECQLFCLFF